jgi:hypothetical protein
MRIGGYAVNRVAAEQLNGEGCRGGNGPAKRPEEGAGRNREGVLPAARKRARDGVSRRPWPSKLRPSWLVPVAFSLPLGLPQVSRPWS